jgi:salicylate hydroxylase
LIVGAGLGGLTAELALRRAGFEVMVLEQATALGEVGAGIQLGPNAVRVLHALGLADELASFAVLPTHRTRYSWQSGEVIRSVPLAEAARERFGYPYYHAHRADLHAALVAALGADGIELGCKCIGYATSDDGVTARLENGGTELGDVLIGADGIHSLVRAQLIGPDRPRFTGNMAWRGLAPAECVADLEVPRVAANWWGPHQHFVHYYVSGGRYLNWVGVVPGDGSEIESWSARGEVADALRDFEGWHPRITGIIGATDTVSKWALYDRDPLPTWSRGRVTLLGDAAHPMLPFMAQGAAQCIEDGMILSRCLVGRAGDPAAALRLYEEMRRERTARTQLGSRRNAELFHAADPDAVRRRDASIQADAVSDRHGYATDENWLFSYDAVNAPLTS